MSALLAFVTALSLAAPVPADSFPHAAHRRLFASCTTCHAGILTGDSATTRPAATACTACHDGAIERRVTWTPAPPRPTNLRFDHREHIREVRSRGDSALACTACHDKLYLSKGQHKAVTMKQMQKGKSCGACHNGKKAFSVKGDCAKCHNK